MSVALPLILVAAAVHAIVNVITKSAQDKYALRLLIGVFSAILVAPALFFVGLPQGAWWFLAATSFIHALYELLLVLSYENASFSAVYPVARGTGPLFVTLGSILFLSQPPPPLQLLGILMVCGGVITIGLSHRGSALKGVGFALATGLTIGAYTLVDASGVRRVADPFTYVLWFFVGHGLSVITTAPSIRGRAVIVAARKQWKLGLVAASLSIVTYGSAMLAYRFGATAQLAALRETSVLFGTALAMAFLGERMTLRQLGAAIVIACGAILLQSG
jgi:drug/metabolite transporter (DMT)-like permease